MSGLENQMCKDYKTSFSLPGFNIALHTSVEFGDLMYYDISPTLHVHVLHT